MKEKVNKNVNQINWLMRTNQSLKERIGWMERVGKHKNQWEIAVTNPFDFLDHCSVTEFLPDTLANGADVWIGEFCAAYMAVRIPRELCGMKILVKFHGPDKEIGAYFCDANGEDINAFVGYGHPSDG